MLSVKYDYFQSNNFIQLFTTLLLKHIGQLAMAFYFKYLKINNSNLKI